MSREKCTSVRYLVLLSLSFCLKVRASEVVVDTKNSTESQLVSTLNALGSALNFFAKEYKNVNLDAVIGTRIVEGTLNVLLSRLDSSGQSLLIPQHYLRNIRALRNLAGEISELAIPHVARNYPDYYHLIGATLSRGLWELDYESRDLSSAAQIWPELNHEAMKETFSDTCVAELFGTGDKTSRMCGITDECWDVMTKFGYSSYSLSHQIFYLEIGERTGCLPEIASKIVKNRQPGISALQETFCANMLQECKLIERNGFSVTRRDLFMEDAALCGMLGFRDFFNSEWLEKILSWQKPKRGCYLASPLEVFEDEDVQMKQSKIRQMARSIQKRHISLKSRVKREEKKLPDGCLFHRTTVAASALAQYVRYITEVWLMEKQ